MDLLEKILDKKEFKIPAKFIKFTLKKYEKSDYNGLLALYNQIFPNYMTRKLWKWKNINNPYGNYEIILVEYKEKIISAYSAAPKIFYINGREIPCFLSLDTMTDSKYQGLGLSTYIASLMYEYLKQKGSYFIYGFPNKNSNHLIFNKLNWIYGGKRNFLTKIIPEKIEDINDYNIYSIKKIKKFDEEIDVFLERYKNNFPVIIKKNRIYLNWRFSEHPLVNYDKYLIIDEKSNNIEAFFVLKKFKDKNGVIFGHIVDYMIGPKSKSIKKKIFTLIENYSINEFSKDCLKISFWLPEEFLKTHLLENLGYYLVVKKKFFGYKIFRYNKQLDILNSPNNWYITMANSDVF